MLNIHRYLLLLEAFFFFPIREHFWQMMIWEIDWPQCSPREIERYTCCSPREIVRTIHNYLSLKGHEADAAVKPEVFIASTHLFMPFEAEIFMDGYIIRTYLSQFRCLFWNDKYCYVASFKMLNIYGYLQLGLLSFFLFIHDHLWQMMIWKIDWPQCSPRYTCSCWNSCLLHK